MGNRIRQNSNWLRQRTNRHPKTAIAIFLILCVTIVPLWIGFINKAWGQCAANNPDGGCYSSSSMARKFRHHKIKHVHGFDPKTQFAHPKAAKRIFVRKIEHKFNHLSAKRQLKIRIAMAGSGKDWYSCDAKCVAQREYNRAVNKASCVADDQFMVIYGICVPDNHHPFTKAGIQAAGSVFFCGTLTVLGIAGAPETMGGTGYLAVFVGGSACGWQAWSAIDPG